MGMMEYLKEGFRKGFDQITSSVNREVRQRVNAEIKKVESKFTRTTLSLTILLLGLLFLAVSVCYLFIEYIGLSRTLSFLIVGALLLLISLLIKVIK